MLKSSSTPRYLLSTGTWRQKFRGVFHHVSGEIKSAEVKTKSDCLSKHEENKVSEIRSAAGDTCDEPDGSDCTGLSSGAVVLVLAE